jgi:hypothetical protein
MSQATIKVNDINLIATWNYTSVHSECVCKRSLHLPTVNQVENKNIYRNDIVFGECGHGMHSECLDNYMKVYGKMCPIDKLPWKQQNSNYKIKYSMIK